MLKIAPLTRIPALASLQYRNYRLYWTGLLVAIIGYQVLTFTQLWLVYELTNSTVYTGLVGGVNGVTNIVLSLFGGVFADKLDRRKLLLITQSFMALLACTLAVLTITKVVDVWHVLVIAGFTGATAAFDSPARQALIPHLIDDRKDLGNAVALGSSVWSAAGILGPAIAGTLIAATSPAICFFVTSSGYITMVLVLRSIHLNKPPANPARLNILVEIKEGWGYVLHNRIFLVLIGMSYFSSMFGFSFMYLLPVFAKDILQVGSSGYGFLSTATGIGSVCGAIVVASLSRRGHRGKLLITGCIVYGALLAVFGISRSYMFSLSVLAMTGLFNAIFLTNVMTSLQALVPDGLRGRVMGIYSLTFSFMPLGGLWAGLMAKAVGAPLTVAIGGSCISVFALVILIFSKRIRQLN